MTSERTESEGFFEMLWDCGHCGKQGLLGKSQRHCAECGAPQDPAKRYLPSPDQQQKIEGHSYVGADRHCPACHAPMSANGNNCTLCGAPLDGSQHVRSVHPPVAAKSRRRLWPYVVAGIVLVGFAIWWFFIRTTQAEVTVKQHRWACSVAIEEYRDVDVSGWRDELPSDAQSSSCVRKQRTTKKVQDGEDCRTERVDKQDGTFEQVKKCKPKYRSERVDGEWCSYTVRRWDPLGPASASGDNLSPECPETGLPPDTAATLGARRQGARKQTLTLDFGGHGTCDVSEPIWRKYTDGQQIKVDVRARSGDVVCGAL